MLRHAVKNDSPLAKACLNLRPENDVKTKFDL